MKLDKFLPKALFLTCLYITLVFVLPSQAFAQNQQKEPGAKTSAPPMIVTPFTAFDPNFRYLDNGSAYINDLSNGSIIMNGSTTATQYVDTLGIKMILQKWNGSSWQDYYIGPDGTQSNDKEVYASIGLQVAKGYYYHIKSTHWIIENGYWEKGERISSSILIK